MASLRAAGTMPSNWVPLLWETYTRLVLLSQPSPSSFMYHLNKHVLLTLCSTDLANKDAFVQQQPQPFSQPFLTWMLLLIVLWRDLGCLTHWREGILPHLCPTQRHLFIPRIRPGKMPKDKTIVRYGKVSMKWVNPPTSMWSTKPQPLRRYNLWRPYWALGNGGNHSVSASGRGGGHGIPMPRVDLWIRILLLHFPSELDPEREKLSIFKY